MLFLDDVPELNPLELTIYHYVRDHLDDVCKMKIRELAANTHTSTTTILRFCKKFECDGFSEFRVKLQLYKEQQHQSHLQPIDETALIDFFKRAMEPAFNEKIKEAVELLNSKSFVLFLGIGLSNIAAEYGSLYFTSIFKLSLRIEDPINYPVHFLSNDLAKQTCIVVCSVSGETKELVNYLTHLNTRDCVVISITNSSQSTVAKLSDINLPYYINQQKVPGADVTSQIPALYILERIAKEVQGLEKKVL
ncbi:MurR/RpiR family transcriptional regulator [Pisciglobus halotolerans]|uniref:DNA-binding transcriptional regulator, MurR/RpiR family, contains HTH and SIS domains n=1 Tax=Pisciglobus halotolerans TaxID=745365 RepID=A0A1I3DZ44_9LACT|nr:MurR/RpiR family transcriptional regulator [Pisciglobus halotolerans]SFH92014.1 DNA-binding transcriptional regulator, MurR/RpiR family, contains HTH and SIS domains [Pisciglobus halotolerans]